jgi:hypothetical protein
MNNYILTDNECRILIKSKGKIFEVLFDREDYARIKNIRWGINVLKSGVYCVGVIGYGKDRYLTKMHRLIMSYPENLLVDHKNRNGLDNRKCNLRSATRVQNAGNALHKSGKPRGVYKWFNRYRAVIQHNNKTIHIGMFPTEKDASEAYKKSSQKLRGEFSPL